MSSFSKQSVEPSVIPVVGKESSNSINENPTVVTFRPGDDRYCYDISDNYVKVIGSDGTHDHGSSRVKLRNIVAYRWEVKHYPGHLVAVHMNGKYFAYVINVKSKLTQMEGMVRVVHASTGLRALIKGMSGEVLDVQFAHIERERVLACIDANSLFVYRVDMLDDSLLCNFVLKLEDPLTNYTPKYDKISWCPYFEPKREDDEEDNQLLVWARGSTFQCLNIASIVEEHGIGKVVPKDISTGYVTLRDDDITITWVVLSPDGTTLSVAATDGMIRFYQIYAHQENPRCLHEWSPHGGKPVSSFFFLDNLTGKVSTAETKYWKYAITAAVNNSELKVWDCGTWECLQTIIVGTGNETTLPRFIAEIDRSASYLVLSSLETRTCYVLQIVNNSNTLEYKEPSNDTNVLANKRVASKGKKLPIAYIKSISEFPLSTAILSFTIVDGGIKHYKSTVDNFLCGELDEYDEDNNSSSCVVVNMFTVESKSMQECRILYQPIALETPIESGNNSTSSIVSNSSNDTSISENDEKKETGRRSTQNGINSKDIEMAEEAIQESDNILKLENNVIANVPEKFTPDKNDSKNVSPKSFPQVNLMTPDAFSTTSERKTPEDVSSEVHSTLLMLAGVTGQTPSANVSDNINRINVVNSKLIEDQEKQKVQINPIIDTQPQYISLESESGQITGDILASGGSSPSREVQEILSLQELDKSSYSGDELEEEEHNAKSIKNEFKEDNEQSKSATSGKLQTDNWSKAPDVPRISNKHSAELQNAANLISQAVNASSMSNLNNSHVVAPILRSSRNNSNNNLTNSNNFELSELNSKLNQLIDIVKKQSKHINSLENEIVKFKKNNTSNSAMYTSELGYKVEMHMAKVVQQFTKGFEIEYNKRINAKFSEDAIRQREFCDGLVKLVNQSISAQSNDVSKAISVEMQRHVTPAFTARFDLLQQQIIKTMNDRRSTLDLMIRETIGQVFANKNIIEEFGKSVHIGVHDSLQTAFVEAMSTTLIPAYEKSSQHMFKQLHESFVFGMNEFMEDFEKYLTKLKPIYETSTDILNKFSVFRQHLDSTIANQQTVVNEALSETRKHVKSLEHLLTREIQESVRKCLENQNLRSQANTPAPMYDLRETIKHLLQQGQINKAFHQALLANDLKLVEFTLKNADHSEAFLPECNLEQKVLLSLIQQISADMSNHNEIKQNYLADALLAIDPTDDISREHAPKVLKELYRNCQMFLVNYPKSPQCSNVRMMMKGVQAYISQF